MGYKRTGRPTGRPKNTRGRYLDDVISATPEGVAITVFDRIVGMCRLGLPFQDACAACGVAKPTAYEWQRQGAQAARDVLNGRRKQAQLTVHEERCWAFVDAVEEARATAAADRLVIVDRLARGGQLVETITSKVDAQDQVIEKTTRQEWRAPSLAAAVKLLEWSHPQSFGPARQRVELSGPDGGPIEVSPREFILERLGMVEHRLTGRPLQLVEAIETTATDVVDNELDPDDFDA